MQLGLRFKKFLPSTVWMILVKEGEVQVEKGKLPARSAATKRQLKQADVARGSICGVWRGTYTALEFSPEIPTSIHQPLRNAWNVHDH